MSKLETDDTERELMMRLVQMAEIDKKARSIDDRLGAAVTEPVEAEHASSSFRDPVGTEGASSAYNSRELQLRLAQMSEIDHAALTINNRLAHLSTERDHTGALEHGLRELHRLSERLDAMSNEMDGGAASYEPPLGGGSDESPLVVVGQRSILHDARQEGHAGAPPPPPYDRDCAQYVLHRRLDEFVAGDERHLPCAAR